MADRKLGGMDGFGVVRRAPLALVAVIALSVMAYVTGCTPQGTAGPVVSADRVNEIRAALRKTASSDGEAADQPGAGGTGWATLQGEFLFDQTASPRPRQPLQITKDVAVCAPGGKTVLDRVMLVDSETRGIANVAIYLRRARRVHEAAQPQAESVLFDQEQCIFETHVMGMVVGQTIQIKNSDPIGHNTNISTSAGAGFNQTIAAGQSTDYQPAREESLPAQVLCNIHPWMVAYILPRANPYFAITQSDGSFRIENLPAGEELEFQVWHERAAGPGHTLVLETDQAKALQWSRKGRFKVTLQPDETRPLSLEVPEDAFQG